MNNRPNIGGVILCGGKSRRMGNSKALLPFGSEVMLSRVVRLLSEVVSPIVVVTSCDQQLPELSEQVLITHDEQDSFGPLEGIRVGLTTIADHAEAAFVTSCDLPLLSDAFVRKMIVELKEYDAAVPVDGEFYHPLAAVYRTHIIETVQGLIDKSNLRMSQLIDSIHTNRVPLQTLRQVDPELRTLMNVNDPADYAMALKLAGM